MTDDTRDRMIRLEKDVEHLSAGFDEMRDKVNEMHTLLTQARGAKWAIIGMASLAGFMSAKLTSLLPWLQNLPR